jgi:hypothetical protein
MTGSRRIIRASLHYPMGTVGPFPKWLKRVADHSPPSSVQVKNALSYEGVSKNFPDWVDN